MTFTEFRRLMFQFHMWIGLVLGILFAALGLSGSAIVYDQEIASFLDPPPAATLQPHFDDVAAVGPTFMNGIGAEP